jgi:hypothetical protein
MIGAPNIPYALYKILTEEKDNKDLVDLALRIIYDAMIALGNNELKLFHEKMTFMDKFVEMGLCEILIQVIEMYSIAENYGYDRYPTVKSGFKYNTNQNVIQLALYIIDDFHSRHSFGHFSYIHKKYISKFITAGIVNCFVKLYNSPFYEDSLAGDVRDIIESLCKFDVNIIEQFNLLGISRDSTLFWHLPEDLI